jgi:hypothetical protein
VPFLITVLRTRLIGRRRVRYSRGVGGFACLGATYGVDGQLRLAARLCWSKSLEIDFETIPVLDNLVPAARSRRLRRHADIETIRRLSHDGHAQDMLHWRMGLPGKFLFAALFRKVIMSHFPRRPIFAVARPWWLATVA